MHLQQSRTETLYCIAALCRFQLILATAAIILFLLPKSVLAQSWTPDGLHVLIGGPQLTIANLPAPGAAGPQTAPLTFSPLSELGALYCPQVASDGKTAAYLTAEHKIVLIDLTSHEKRELPDTALTAPVWSPQASKVAAFFKADGEDTKLVLHYRDEGNAVTVPVPFRTVLQNKNSSLAWVAGSDDFVLLSADNNRSDLFLIEQGQPVPLTSTGDVLGFAISEDGKSIIFARKSLNTHYILFSLYQLTIQTRTVSKLNFPNVIKEVNPNPHNAPEAVDALVFSPDLKKIAFVTRGGPNLKSSDVTLYTTDVTGKNTKLVGRGAILDPKPKMPLETGYSFPANLPAFSPQNDRLAVLRVQGNKRFLMIVNLNSGKPIISPLGAGTAKP